MEMRPEVASKSAAVKVATPLVLPSAAAFVPVMVSVLFEKEVVRPLVPEYVLVATHCGCPAFQVRTWPPVPVPKKVEVAMAVTLPVAEVLLTKTLFAAICASLVSATPFVVSESVPDAPPTRDPSVPP